MYPNEHAVFLSFIFIIIIIDWLVKEDFIFLIVFLTYNKTSDVLSFNVFTGFL